MPQQRIIDVIAGKIGFDFQQEGGNTTLYRVLSAFLLVISAYLLILGLYLAVLGGSLYYFVLGAIYLVSSIALRFGSIRAAYFVAIGFLVTIIWSFYEVGLSYWGLFPRLLTPLALLALISCVFYFTFKSKRGLTLATGVFSLLVFLGLFYRAFLPESEVSYKEATAFNIPQEENKPVDWVSYSRDTAGIRYSPFTQINRDNVKDLKLAWTYRTGRNTANPNAVDQNTPLQIGNTLYACTPENAIHAIDAVTGKRKWIFEAKASAYAWMRCRGLGYYHDETVATGISPRPVLCGSRIIGNTVDGRLFALDAATGALCPNFGTNGMVDLRKHMGPEGPGYYYPNSAPLVAGDKIVIGGWVSDNQRLGEPAGALRAFDVHTGALVWAWDPGNPAVTKDPIKGDTYTLGTPNMWTTAAYDPQLGLVYAPMGNGGTDYFNANRPVASAPYNAALVALDVNTGRPKWAFQTVHNDLWDYDIPAQPALLDMPNDKGQTVPAVLVFTKRGQIFVLDRRNGQPITKVKELPVPTRGSVRENKVSPTQPYSVEMPLIGPGRLTEASAWGMTTFDQLLCRISFRKLRYDGDFTPPGLDSSLANPGVLGGLNWGSASFDPVNKRLFVNDIRMANVKRMLTRGQYDQVTRTHQPSADGHGLAPMTGTPYAVENAEWYSPLGVPCQQPPFGTVTAIDLPSRKIVWQVPAGTAEELGPLGVKLGLPLWPGMPTYAGTSTTAGGLVFFSGYQDFYLRAYDAETGKILWKVPLPVGSSATPMTYISPANHKQYVLVSVGGAAHSSKVGDYIMAFALPDPK